MRHVLAVGQGRKCELERNVIGSGLLVVVVVAAVVVIVVVVVIAFVDVVCEGLALQMPSTLLSSRSSSRPFILK